MKRDLNRLSENAFDVLIIGGGIHGAAIAYKIAASGFKTALIEQKDFCSATSANSLKIIHGGIRYFQHLNFKRIRESVKSRRAMMRIAPNLVRPLPCVMPTYGFGLKGKHALQIVLQMNDLFSFDRNRGLKHADRIPDGKILSKEECLNYIPGLKKEGLSGGALWYDALAVSTERLALTYIIKAAEKGAQIANYVTATDLLKRGNVVHGIRAKDVLTGERFDITAKLVINAAGSWISNTIRSSKLNHIKWQKGLNIIVKKRLFSDCAVGLEESRKSFDPSAVIKSKNRLLFFVPWRNYTLIGTTYKPYSGTPEELNISKDEIRELVEETNRIYPVADLNLNDVTFFHYGILPAKDQKQDSSSTQIDNHSEIIDHERVDNLKGIITIKGVKYTTAPQIAEETARLLKKRNISKTSHSHKPIPRHIDEDDRSEPELLLNEDPPLTAAEVLFSIREEMALKLSDIVFRRTDLGTAEQPAENTLHSIAKLMAEELSWDNQRILSEISEVQSCYRPN